MPEKRIKYNYGDLEQLFKENVGQQRKTKRRKYFVAPLRHTHFLEFQVELLVKNILKANKNIESDKF